MKNVLVHISGAPGQPARLQAALDIGRSFSGHLLLCQPSPPPVIAGGLAPGTMWTTVTFEDMAKHARARRGAIKTEIQTALEGEDVPWSWQAVEGFSQEAFVSQTALADLAVVTLGEENDPFSDGAPFLKHVVMHSPAPVLAMPQDTNGFNPFGTAMIAWDGSFEAAKAVRGSLPLLAKAESVLAFSIGAVAPDRPDLSALGQYLSRHGITASTDDVAPNGHVSDTLLETAKMVEASYIVMGAYGHSRLLETILGGETERMLNQSQLAIIFAH